MKKIIFSIAAVAVALSSQAQLLWKVSGGDAKGDSYIFGTHHIAPVTMIDSTPGLNDAINSVATVYGEIDMADMASPETQQIAMKYSMAPADSTLSKVLTVEQLDSVNSLLAKYTGGMLTVSAVEAMKPIVLSTQIGMFQNMVAFPEFTGQEQLDQLVQEKARSAGKEVKGLETLEQQLGLLMGGTVAEQVDNLMETVRKDESSVENAKALAAAYVSADLDAIQKLFDDPEIGMSPEMSQKLIYDRNDNWVAQLRDILPSENVLVAVGVGHFIGEKGLIEQLRKAGYTVTPVK